MTTGDEPSIGGDKRIDSSGAEPKLGGEAAILHLVEMLHHTDRKVRYRAALKLAESGDDRVFDTLVEMLQDGNGTPHLRERAALALGQLGNERAVEPLVASINTTRAYYVVKALAQIGGDRVFEAIEELFDQHIGDNGVSFALREVLSEMGGQRVVEFLAAALENDTGPDPGPGFLAAATLRKMGDQTTEVLFPLLTHESGYVRRHALIALGEARAQWLVEPLLTLLNDDDPYLVRKAIYKLGYLQDARIFTRIIGFLNHPDPRTSKITVVSLGILGDSRAVKPLLKFLDSPDEELRESSIKALGKIGHPSAVRGLGQALIECKEKTDAVNLADALLEIDTGEALQFVVRAIWQSPEAEVRDGAASALVGEKGPDVGEALRDILRRHPDSDVRWKAADTLGEFQQEGVVEALIEALADPDYRIRGSAASSLGDLRDERAVEPLIVSMNDNSPLVRKNAAIALGLIGGSRGLELMIQAVNTALDEDMFNFEGVIGALGRLGDRRAVEPLIRAINQDYAVKQAAWALGRLEDKRAVESLIRVLIKHDENSWVAAESLGRLGDERAVEPLKDALYFAAGEMVNPPQVYHFDKLFEASEEALKKIGTPEALAAIEDLPFRDLGDTP